MNTLEILGVAIASVAGILVAAAATISCATHAAQAKRDRQLIETYATHPERVEAWLVDNAIEYLKRSGTA